MFPTKKHNGTLSILIGLVLIAMFLPWAYLSEEYITESEVVYRPAFGLFALGAPLGLIYTSISFVLALAAFLLSFFSGKSRVCRVLCGLLLLGSAAVCIYDGGYDCFTVLTWCIIGALVLLGLWTLLFFGRKTSKAS